jgi:hypothetical protein
MASNSDEIVQQVQDDFQNLLAYVTGPDARAQTAYTVEGSPLTRLYLRYGLAETVFDLWTKDPRIFGGYRRYGERLIQLLEADRALVNPPTLKKNFIRKIRDDLRLYGITEPATGVVPLARWIYAVPSRCPGVRLRYEVYHEMRRNKAAKVKPSDMVDLLRISALPYVDIITMDAPMMTYTSQVIRKLAVDYESHIFSDLEGAFSRLCGREHPGQ